MSLLFLIFFSGVSGVVFISYFCMPQLHNKLVYHFCTSWLINSATLATSWYRTLIQKALHVVVTTLPSRNAVLLFFLLRPPVSYRLSYSFKFDKNGWWSICKLPDEKNRWSQTVFIDFINRLVSDRSTSTPGSYCIDEVAVLIFLLGHTVIYSHL